MPLFKGKKKSSVGIDVGTSSVKIVELAEKGDKAELVNYGEFRADAGSAIHSASVKLSASQAAEIVKQVTSAAKINTEGGVAMSVPIFSGFATLISLPAVSEGELDQVVSYEARKYIPLPMSEVQFEWIKIDNSDSANGAGQGKTVDILIVAVTNELINKYTNIAKMNNLELKYLELDVFSLARSLVGDDVATALIIDIGSQNTNLSIVQKQWPVFTRTIDVSGAEFSRIISSSLGIDFLRADEIKKKDGVNAGERILYPLLDTIFMEAKRAMTEHYSRKKIAVEKVIISGGSARMPGLVDYAKKVMEKKEIVIGFPFRDIIYPKILEGTLKELAPSFDVAVGLALREFRQQ